MNVFYLALALVVQDPSDAVSARAEVRKIFPTPISESDCRDAAKSKAILEDYGTGESGEFLICIPADFRKLR